MESIVPPSEAVAMSAVSEDKTVAVVGYLTIVGFIAAIILYQNKQTRLGAFHLRQMLGMALTAAAGSLLWVIPILGWIAWFVIAIGLFGLWVMGLLSAVKGEMRPVPILGTHYQRWFANVFA